MSRAGLIVSLVAAAVLTLVAAYLYGPAGAGASPGERAARVALIPFDAQQATALEVEYPDASAVRAERAGRTLDWWIVIEPADRPARVWAASQASVRTALRLLGTLEPVTPESAGAIERPGATVTLETPDDTFSLDLAPRTVGGKGLVSANVPGTGPIVATVPAEVHDLAMNPGPAIWRERLAVPGLAGAGVGEISRVQLRAGDRALLLTRVQGRWSLFPDADQSVPGIEADPEAVQRLLAAVAQTGIARFIDEPTPDDVTGLDAPTATITLVSTRRLASGERRDRNRTLRVGRAVGLSDETLFATLDDSDAASVAGPDAEPQLFAVDGAALATLPMLPSAYVSPIAVVASAGDVGEVVLRPEGQPPLELTRTLDGWRRVADDEQRVPTPDERRVAEQVIALATRTPGTPAMRNGAAWAPIGTVELRALGGAPLASFDLGLATGSEGQPDRVVLADDRVARTYPPEAANAIIAWLTP